MQSGALLTTKRILHTSTGMTYWTYATSMTSHSPLAMASDLAPSMMQMTRRSFQSLPLKVRKGTFPYFVLNVLQQQHLDRVLWSFTNSVVSFQALLPMFKGWHFHGHCPEWKLPHAGQYTYGFGLNT
jgi:hypothetical protein